MQFIKSVVHENYTTKLVSNEIKVNYKVMNDSKTIAEKFNEHFTNVVTHLQIKFHDIIGDVTDYINGVYKIKHYVDKRC